MSWITGVGLTRFGKLPESTTLDLMSEAAALAIADAGLERRDIDGVICGYSTTLPHLMLATVFAEHFGIAPSYAHCVQMGGATGSPKHHLSDAPDGLAPAEMLFNARPDDLAYLRAAMLSL